MAQGQLSRLTALAIATGTLAAAAVAAAGPASAVAAAESRLTATGSGSALKLTINLPAALTGTPLGQRIEQTISLTNGSVSTISGPLASTTAILGQGTTPILSDLLNQSTSALLTGQREQTSGQAADIDQLGLKLRLLPLMSKVADPELDGVLAHSSSALAHLSVGGLAVPGLSTVTAPVAAALETALGTAGGGAEGSGAGAVGSALTGAIGTLNDASGGAATPVTEAVQAAIDAAITALEGTLQDLTGTTVLLAGATDLISLDSIVSDQTISREGATVTSAVSNSVKNVNVLNGLLKISAVESVATAVAGGTPGSGSATTKAPVLDLSLADGALEAIIDQNGITVGGTIGEALPPELQGAVNEAIAAVNGLLAEQLGLDVQLGKGVTSVSPDGRSAAAAVGATKISLNPLGIAELLGADEPFLAAEFVTANAAVGSQLVPAPAAPAGVAPTSLPRTGGSLPLTGALATLLVGAALVVRRRHGLLG